MPFRDIFRRRKRRLKTPSSPAILPPAVSPPAISPLTELLLRPLRWSSSETVVGSTTTLAVKSKRDRAQTWRQRRQENEQTSALYGLPDDVLRRIIVESTFVSQQMIRQTCSRFAALVTSLDPDRTKKPFDFQFGKSQVWPGHGSLSERRAIRRQWATLIRRDIRDLCDGCRAIDESGELDDRVRRLRDERLWCSGCHEYHARGFFPADQRPLDNEKRKCIGWTGSIPICRHESLTWSAYLEAKKKSTPQGWPPAWTDIPARECARKESCHWHGSYSSLSTLTPRAYDNYRKNAPPTSHFKIAITWANRLFDLDSSTSRPESRQPFRDALAALDSSSSSGPVLCPHMRFDDGQLLLTLEPGRCCCFTDSSASPPTEPGYTAQQHIYTDDVCSTRCRCRHEKHYPVNDETEQWNPRPDFLSWPGAETTHTCICPTCGAMYIWRRQGHGIHLECMTAVSAASPTSPHWIRKLDPHSWNITDDKETEHVYWCPDTSCRTNYHWHALYRRLGVPSIWIPPVQQQERTAVCTTFKLSIRVQQNNTVNVATDI